MGDSFHNPGSGKNSEVISVVSNKTMSKRCSINSSPKPVPQKSTRHMGPFNDIRIGMDTAGNAALFVVKVAALETVRRFSRERCPFIWHGIQALQVLCYPPLKWILRWAPLKGIVNSMEALSRPLLVLSIATAFSDQSGFSKITSDAINDSTNSNELEASSESNSESSSVESTLNISRVLDEATESQSSEKWLIQLYAELENKGINLPDRIDEDELRRFYVAANGDFSCLLSSVMKTIRWRETYNILSGQELERWSNMVFWHGFDVKYRPCLIVRLGLACSSLSSHERPCFIQAVVSQVEHGILHLVDPENPQITVLMDCKGLSQLRFPMQMMRWCSGIFQDHFPNRLGLLFVIRLPPVVRVIAQTFMQVLKPVTRQKLIIEGEMYQKVIMENFQTLPSFLGGTCKCRRCSNLDICNARLPQIIETKETERKIDTISCEEMLPPHVTDVADMEMNGNCNQLLRTAVVGIIIFWVLIAFIAGVYDPESHPALPS